MKSVIALKILYHNTVLRVCAYFFRATYYKMCFVTVSVKNKKPPSRTVFFSAVTDDKPGFFLHGLIEFFFIA